MTVVINVMTIYYSSKCLDNSDTCHDNKCHENSDICHDNCKKCHDSSIFF